MTSATAGLSTALQRVQLMLQHGQRASALDLLKDLVPRHPEHPGLLFLAAHTAHELEELAQARRYLQVLESAPLPDGPVSVDVVLLYRDCGMWEAANRYAARLAEADPGNQRFLVMRADLAAGGGDLELAAELYHQALDRDPGCAPALYYFARDKTQDAETQLARIQAVNPDTVNPGERALLGFAAGRCLARLGRHSQAFEAYAQANEHHRQGRQDFGLDRKLKAAPGFVAEFEPRRLAAARKRGHPSRRPVFVVGMPRSGTTLIEQIIASHPQADSVGERRFIGNLVGQALRKAPAKQSLIQALVGSGKGLKRIGAGYLERVATLVPDGSERVVDKLPFNFALAGSAHLVFPRSTVVHACRDRHDVCWSMFTTPFRSDVLRFTLAEIGQLQALKDFVLAAWAERFPLQEVAYEDLVEDFEPRARALVTGTGLKWSEACLSFHERQSTVATASVLQVRRPLYRSSVGRAEPYRAWMGDFDQAYEATLAALQGRGP